MPLHFATALKSLCASRAESITRAKIIFYLILILKSFLKPSLRVTELSLNIRITRYIRSVRTIYHIRDGLEALSRTTICSIRILLDVCVYISALCPNHRDGESGQWVWLNLLEMEADC
jgi:hypothetical protein